MEPSKQKNNEKNNQNPELREIISQKPKFLEDQN